MINGMGKVLLNELVPIFKLELLFSDISFFIEHFRIVLHLQAAKKLFK